MISGAARDGPFVRAESLLAAETLSPASNASVAVMRRVEDLRSRDTGSTDSASTMFTQKRCNGHMWGLQRSQPVHMARVDIVAHVAALQEAARRIEAQIDGHFKASVGKAFSRPRCRAHLAACR